MVLLSALNNQVQFLLLYFTTVNFVFIFKRTDRGFNSKHEAMSVPESESESDDEMPQLSAHALAALQEFYDDQNNKMRAVAAGFNNAKDVEIDEDWVIINYLL